MTIKIQIIGKKGVGKSAIAQTLTNVLESQGKTVKLDGVSEQSESLQRVNEVVEIVEKVESGIKLLNWVKRIFD